MAKLRPSLTGDNFTDQDKISIWVLIHYFQKCPNCEAGKSMVPAARGRMMQLLECKYCHMTFWTTPFKLVGAYPYHDSTPTTTELQAELLLFYSDPLYLEHNPEPWQKYKRSVWKHYPDFYHTLAWDEHPEDYEDTCFCATCRDYMAQDG